jgi:hypothetical protein
VFIKALLECSLIQSNIKITITTPHLTPLIPRVPVDTKLPTKIGGDPILPVKAGTPIAHMGKTNPHAPIYMQCSDLVVNKGHQFGIDLSLIEKQALIEFMKTL